MSKKALCVISGGMDSAVATAIAKSLNYEIIALHFNYRQHTENKELSCFEALATHFKAAQKIVLDLPFIATNAASALTAKTKIKNHSDLPATYVPFRNGIFLSISVAIAQANGAEAIFLGAVEEDSSGYPDCTEVFLNSFEKAACSGTASDIKIFAPLLHLSKAEIIAKAAELAVPLDKTWSCYENSDLACGRCDSCRLRLRGFEIAGLNDPISYEKP